MRIPNYGKQTEEEYWAEVKQELSSRTEQQDEEDMEFLLNMFPEDGVIMPESMDGTIL